MFLEGSRQRWCFGEGSKCLETLTLHIASVAFSHLEHVVNIFNLFEEAKSDGWAR